MAVTKIYLKSVKKDLGNGMEYCLELRDSNGNTGTNDLKTEAPGGSKVLWKLDSNSGIKGIIRIYADAGQTNKIFKHEPNKLPLRKAFMVDVADNDSDQVIEEKYNIIYVPEGTNTEVPIDPYLRIPRRT